MSPEVGDQFVFCFTRVGIIRYFGVSAIPSRNSLKFDCKGHAVHDAPATVLQQLILWQTQKTKPVTNLSHERVHALTEDRIDLPRFVRPPQHCRHHAKRVFAELKCAVAIA